MAAVVWSVFAAALLGAAPPARPPPTAVAPELQLSRVQWGMSRAELRRALGLRDDAPFGGYSHLPASWTEFRATARLVQIQGFLHFWVSPSGLRMLGFRPAKRPKGMCRQDLDTARRTLEKEFGPARERSGTTRTCFEWSPSGGGLLRACCQALIPEEWPDTRIAYLDVMLHGPKQPGDEPVEWPLP